MIKSPNDLNHINYTNCVPNEVMLCERRPDTRIASLEHFEIYFGNISSIHLLSFFVQNINFGSKGFFLCVEHHLNERFSPSRSVGTVFNQLEFKREIKHDFNRFLTFNLLKWY